MFRFSRVQPARAGLGPGQVRTFMSLFRKTEAAGAAPAPSRPVVLAENDLFHPLSQSPFPEMREKGERIKQLAYCPVSLEKYGERRHVDFECPNCGYPTHATQERWAEDTEKGKYWPRIREANEDEHDLRSGRYSAEYPMPGGQDSDHAVSLANWDLFLYTRGFPSVDSDRVLRHVTKLLSFPVTIGSILHQFGPYTTKSWRLLPEGLRSLLALRQTLHPPPKTADDYLNPPVAMRLFILGARAESMLPSSLWQQLSYLFPDVPFQIYFIGPEAFVPQDQQTPENESVYGVPSYRRVDYQNVALINIQSDYHTVHNLLGPFDPYLDAFFAFSPGFGFPDDADPSVPQLETNWREAIEDILDTKCALFCTGFSPADIERDVVAIEKSPSIDGEFDWILTPGENHFSSLKWEIAEFDPRIAIKANWGVYGIRGKLYEVDEKQDPLNEVAEV